MNAENRKSVENLTTNALMILEEKVQGMKDEEFEGAVNHDFIARMEMARQVSLLTDEVRKMVALQGEAVNMAKGMMDRMLKMMPGAGNE